MTYKIATYHKDVEALIKRETKARSLQDEWRSLLEEAFNCALPDRETFRAHSQGERKNRHIYDSTAIDGLEIFANKIQMGFFPEWMHWCEFKAGDDIDPDDRDEVDEILEQATKRFFSEFQQSNFPTEITPALKEYGISTGCLEIEAGRLGRNEPIFHFVAIPLAELEVEPHPYGEIKNSWRKHKLTVETVLGVWPDADLPRRIKEKFDKDKQTEIEILNGHLYNPDEDNYWQYIISAEEKYLLFSQNFKTRRRIAFRESVVAGEAYGRGPIIRQLPNIQTLNLVKDFLLRNGAIQMAGMYTGVDDGIFNPHTVRIAPGTVIPVSSNNSQNPTLQRLESSGDIGLGQLIIKDLQDAINAALFAQPLGEIGRPVTSAMENLLRYQDDMRRSGTSFGRLYTELVVPLALGCVDIMQQRGVFDKNLKIDGRQIKIKMVSPLAKQKELEDFNNSQIYLQNILQLPQEIAMLSVPLEKFPKYWAEKLSIPTHLRRTDAETKALSGKIMGMAEQLIAQSAQGGGQQGAPQMGGIPLG